MLEYGLAALFGVAHDVSRAGLMRAIDRPTNKGHAIGPVKGLQTGCSLTWVMRNCWPFSGGPGEAPSWRYQLWS